MRLFTFYSIVTILLVACKPEVEEKAKVVSPADIQPLEQKYAQDNDVATANELVVKYAEYISTHLNDDQNNSKYLRRTARIYMANNEEVKAASTIVLGLKKYYGSKETEANIATLVTLYKRMDNQDAAETTMNGYIMAFPNGAKTADYIQELGDKQVPLNERLQTIAENIVQTDSNEPGLNPEAVNKFVGVAEIYALTNAAADTLASDYLFKAGKLAMTLGNLGKANECYQWIYGEIPDSKEAPAALFTHAFTLDNQMGRKEEAKELYALFLSNHPDHHFADDAQFQLDNLGKDDAQIIEDFNQKANSK